MKYQALFVLFLGFSSTVAFSQNKEIYHSDDLIVEQLSPSTFRHITYLQTNDFGKVACNGMLVINNKEALVFDTPSYDSVSIELIQFLEEKMDCKIAGVVVNHFHIDCLGGLKAFHDRKIPSYANHLTIELAAQEGYEIPEVGFDSLLVLKAGTIKVQNFYAGPAHTRDNIYSYVPAEKVLFGGCSVKSMNAGKGNLADADINSWPSTMQIILDRHKDGLDIVIPGHGKTGGPELLNYTAKMFGNKKKKKVVAGRS
ncbi:MAG: subclass B1 metallo-beta-lactamase, partial [Saprospiraceae bacterium]|nr:subclass B1 metallo-beta-lactamase [Saprospiraceae bacterium]